MTLRWALAVLLVLASGAVAVGQQQGQQPGQQLPSDWITDSQGGCRTWNAAPRVGESVTWEGACVDGYVEGKGVLRWFLNGVVTEIDAGEFRKGKLEGHAEMTNGPTFRFEGEFHDHLPNGQGTMHDSDGQVYSGQWVNGCFSEGGRRKAFGVGASCDFQS
jgi:hypothetical protein